MTGTVYLVGAGPGGPDLLTRRGAALLAQADCVIYDRLVDPRIVALAGPGCERIDVGKTPARGPSPSGAVPVRDREQAAIHALLVKKAARHRTVVRLKGGDPLLFGRGAEELAALAAAKVRFEIVPGVSSVHAAAAYAGIPLTDRVLSSSVTVVTGQAAAATSRTAVRWRALAKGSDTLVVLMGRQRLSAIVGALRRAGRPATTPIALVRWAGRPEQATLVATLGTITARLAAQPEFGPPIVAIVGEVVRLRERYAWWQRPPLAGRQILVTRAEGEASDLVGRLEQLGATCVEIPAIAVTPRRLGPQAERTLAGQLASYDWVIFTSPHGVKALAALLARQGRDARAFGPAQICAVGPKTAAALESLGVTPDLVPAAFSTAGIAAAFRRRPLAKARVLIPRSSLAVGDPLAQGLRAKGAIVSEVPLYDTTVPQLPKGLVAQRLAGRAIDLATFTSASTVKNLLVVLEQAGFEPRRVLNGAQVAVIGPQTAAAAKSAGLAVHIMPRTSWTLDGLVEALVAGGARR